MITALVYLNEVSEGGETEFVNLGLKVSPLAGRVLVFHNCYNRSATSHPDSYHAGCPPTVGEKWAVNLWYHERPYPAADIREAAALAVALGLQEEEATATASDGAPSMDEVRAACPAEATACERNAKCNAALVDALLHGPAAQQHSSPLLARVMECFVEAAMAELDAFPGGGGGGANETTIEFESSHLHAVYEIELWVQHVNDQHQPLPLQSSVCHGVLESIIENEQLSTQANLSESPPPEK